MQSQFNVLGLAAQLARPIAFGWLPRQLADAALANAVLRYEFYDEDSDRALVTSWHITLQLVDRITVERRQAAWSKAGRRAVVGSYARRAVWRAAVPRPTAASVSATFAKQGTQRTHSGASRSGMMRWRGS